MMTADNELQSPYSLSAVMTESGTCEVMAMFWTDGTVYDMEVDVTE